MTAAKVTDHTATGFPATRYQGSKAKLAHWIVGTVSQILRNPGPGRVLDAFSGTGAVGYAFKQRGWGVTVNDLLAFNYRFGRALVENDAEALSDGDVRAVLAAGADYRAGFIAENFAGIFYSDEENVWLDQMAQAIHEQLNGYRQDLALYALCQAALQKRPFNLFHRANYALRVRDVPRGFGNKATWDRPFADVFVDMIRVANQALFVGRQPCRATWGDVMDAPEDFDVVYLDPPYMDSRGRSFDYLDGYHFLEGLVQYRNWPGNVLPQYKHRPLRGKGDSPWLTRDGVRSGFRRLLDKFRHSTIVVSYRADGIPALDELEEWLRAVKPRITVAKMPYRYVLSRRSTEEALLVGSD